MKSRSVRSCAAALALLVCLSGAPVAAADGGSTGRDFSERVRRFVQKIQQLAAGISSNSNYPAPPKP